MVKEVEVKIATDQAFKSLYWSFSPGEVKKAVSSALAIFERQFPEVHFLLARRIENWDSIPLPLMRDFPTPLILDLPRVSSFAKALRIVQKRAEELGFHQASMIRKKENLQQIVKNTQGFSKTEKFRYLMGYLTSMLNDEMLFELKQKFPCVGNELTLGFTGKVFIAGFAYGSCLGTASGGGHWAVFPVQYNQKLFSVVLHEIGHLFGAKDLDNDVVSIMNSRYVGETLEFDPENIELIRGAIAKM